MATAQVEEYGRFKYCHSEFKEILQGKVLHFENSTDGAEKEFG